MTANHHLVGDVIHLVRRPVDVELDQTYREIGIRSFGKGIFHKEPISGSELGGKRVFQIEPGDLVFSNVFAWEGAVARATSAEQGFIGSHRFMTYRVSEQTADADYLRYFFTSEKGLGVIRKASPGSAGRNKTLGIDTFASQSIALPAIDEQRRIAMKLDHTFTGIGEVARHREQVKSLQANVLHSTLWGLPRRPFGDGLAVRSAEVSVDPSERYKISGIYSFGRGLIRRPEIYGADTSYQRLTPLQPGIVVMSKLNGWEGALAVVQEEFTGYYVSPEYPTFDIDRTILEPGYVAHLVKWPRLWEELTPRGSMVRRKRTSAQRLLEVEIPFPELDEQRRLAGMLDRVAEAGKLAEHQESLVSALRHSLLNAAFSGEL